MAHYYKAVNINTGIAPDRKVKVTSTDTSPNFLSSKVSSIDSAIVLSVLNPAANAILQIDLDETQIDHNNLLNYDVDEHRPLDDSLTTSTNLWSASKIQTELNTKIDKVASTDNAIVRFDGTSGDVQNSGVIIDDSNNVSGVNDLIVSGDLIVNGTQTIINTQVLEVEDANILVNKGGDQASANTQGAGITVEMSDATDAALSYDSSLNSRFKIGEIGSQSEIVTVSHTQTIINKTIDADDNTISDLQTSNLKAGVLVTDLSVSVTHTQLPSAQSVKDYAVAQSDFDTLFDNRLATKTTDDLSEGLINLYFTDERAQDAVGNILTDSTSIDFTYNDAADTITAVVIPSGVDHNSLNNYVANEHIDHSSVNINAGTGLSGGGDITTSRTLSLAINSLTAKTSASSSDELAVYDTSLTGHRKITVQNIVDLVSSTNDIQETSFSFDENKTNEPITGFLFSSARSFLAHVSVFVDASSDLFEVFEIRGIRKSSDWEISISSDGDDSLVSFSISPSGQMRYTTPLYTGFSSGVMRFRAITTEV